MNPKFKNLVGKIKITPNFQGANRNLVKINYDMAIIGSKTTQF